MPNRVDLEMSVEPAQNEFQTAEYLSKKCERLERQLVREKAIRLEAEDIAEHGLRDLFLSRERLELLNRVSSFANDCEEPRDALQFAINEICEAAEWPVGHALIRKGPVGDARLEGTDIWAAQDQDLSFPFMEASRTLVAWPCASTPGRLFLETKPTWVTDIHAQSGFTRSSAAMRSGLRSSISVPVIMGHELVGALEFYQTDTVEPKPEFLELLLQIGIQIGRVFKRRKHADILRENAATDSLTGLPNRLAFEKEVRDIFDLEHQKSDFQSALIYLDLDGFKLVNDTLGHVSGDMLLVAMAGRLQTIVNSFKELTWVEYALLARIGGDEFVIIIRGDEIEEVVKDMAEAVHKCLHPVHRIGSSNVQAAASIGIALNGPEYTDPQELMRDADVAMYEAKSEGTEQTVTFSSQMRTAALKRLDMEADLRVAINTSAFELHFQPIVSLGDRKLVGYEALIRWQRSADELVMPEEFIAAAETCGLIVPIGTWVLREACRAAVRFQTASASETPLTVSINVALQQFQQPHFVSLVRDILLETGANSQWIRLELTESAAATNPKQAKRVIEQLSAMGIQVSIDDFGTGYSSLAHLQAMPFNTIKIDRSFIAKQFENSADWSFVAAMKQLADSLNMNVIVEGIESEFQQAELESLGCQFGQGWLYGKPKPESIVIELLENS
ncbi:MAG: GGDEF domain-containing protein [Roseobacter sp.]